MTPAAAPPVSGQWSQRAWPAQRSQRRGSSCAAAAAAFGVVAQRSSGLTVSLLPMDTGASACHAATISASPACPQTPAPNHVQCGHCLPLHAAVCVQACPWCDRSSNQSHPMVCPSQSHLALRSAASAQPQKMAACSSGNTQTRCEAVAPASMKPAGTEPGRSSSS